MLDLSQKIDIGLGRDLRITLPELEGDRVPRGRDELEAGIMQSTKAATVASVSNWTPYLHPQSKPFAERSLRLVLTRQFSPLRPIGNTGDILDAIKPSSIFRPDP